MLKKSISSRKEAFSTQKSCPGLVEVPFHFVCLLFHFLGFIHAIDQKDEGDTLDKQSNIS